MKNKEKIKDLLIVVDMVNGFVNEGVLADPYIQRLIPYQKALIEHYQTKENKEVAFIKDTHEKDSKEFESFPPHCLKGTKESELTSELKPYENNALVYQKNSTSVIFAPNFMDDIKAMKELKRIILTGCCTDICVINAAVPLINYFNQNNIYAEVYVPENLSETYEIKDIHDREKYNHMAFTLMKQAGIKTNVPDDLQKVLTKDLN